MNSTSTESPKPSSASGSPNSNAPPLPSKTIIALSLGFIAAALAVVAISGVIRAREVRAATAQARARGEQVNFREVWRQSGGWWGAFFNEDTRWSVVRVKKSMKPPLFWEVVMDRSVLDPQDEFRHDAQPLAAVASRATEHDADDIVISALILLPAQDGDDEIPDLMIGTTHLSPTIPLAQAGLDKLEQDDEPEEEYVVQEVRRPQPHWSTAWGLDTRIP